MSSSAELPELVGFFSYSRDDDDDAKGALSALRDRINRELRGQLGRSRSEFRLWQDKTAIPQGALWEEEIRAAIAQSAFFIPIITPSTLRSKHCKTEFELFLAREAEFDRRDLIFPILYIRVPALEDERQWRQDELLRIIGSRQYFNWQPLRFLDVDSPEVAKQVEQFCTNIYRALQQPFLTPQERREAAAEAARQKEEERRQKAEAEARQKEAERRAEEEERRRADAAKAAAAEEERRKAAAAQAAEEERRKIAAAEAVEEERRKAAQTAEEEERRKVALAAAQAADEARLAAENTAKHKTGASGEAAAQQPDTAKVADEFQTTTSPPSSSAPWFDVKSWSYTKIAVIAALLGLIVGLTTIAQLYGLPLGRNYFLSAAAVLYAAATLLFVAKLTTNLGILRLSMAFVGLYIFNFLAGSITNATNAIAFSLGGLTLFRLAVVLGTAMFKVLVWLAIAGYFLSFREVLRDKKMLVVAATMGVVQGLGNVTAIGVLSRQLAVVSFSALQFGITAIMFAYGISRQRSNPGKAAQVGR